MGARPDRTAPRDAPPPRSASSGLGRWGRGSPRSRSRPATGWSSTIRTPRRSPVVASGSPMGSLGGRGADRRCPGVPRRTARSRGSPGPTALRLGPREPGSGDDVSSRPSPRISSSSAGCSPRSTLRRRRPRSWPRTRARCPLRPSPRRRAVRAGSSACISSTRHRSCRSSKSSRQWGRRLPPRPPRRSSSGTGRRRLSAPRTRLASSSTG